MNTATHTPNGQETIITAKPKGAPDNMFLTEAEIRQEIKDAAAEAKRGEFATEEEVSERFASMRETCRSAQ